MDFCKYYELSKAQIKAVVCKAKYCHIGVVTTDTLSTATSATCFPYVLPMQFELKCVDDVTVIKIKLCETGELSNAIQANPNVCLTFTRMNGCEIQSVVANGTATVTTIGCPQPRDYGVDGAEIFNCPNPCGPTCDCGNSEIEYIITISDLVFTGRGFGRTISEESSCKKCHCHCRPQCPPPCPCQCPCPCSCPTNGRPQPRGC